MNTLNLKAQHEDSAIGQILSLKSQIIYHKKNIAPFYHEMEKWEQKEYFAVNKDNEIEFDMLKNHIISNEPVFNQLLSEYNLSVAVFINKFILN